MFIINMTRYITIASGKGGVGKTTLVTNLGAALNQFGKNVIVLDGNISTPNVSVLLGMTKLPITLHDVLAGKANLKQAIYMHPSGFKVIPAGLSIHHSKLKIKRELAEAINEIAGEADFVIIDCAAGLGNEAKQAMYAGDELILITTPEIHAVTDALKAHEFSKDNGIKPMGVVINRVTGKDWEMTKNNVEEFMELPVISMIPEDENVKRAIAKKKPVVYLYPKTKASKEIKRLAAKLIGEDYRNLENPSFIERLMTIFGLN